MYSRARPLGDPSEGTSSKPCSGPRVLQGPRVQPPGDAKAAPGTSPPPSRPPAPGCSLPLGDGPTRPIHTEKVKKSGYHGNPLLPLGSVPPHPSIPIRQSLKDSPHHLLIILKVPLPHWEHSDLVGMISGSLVPGTEAVLRGRGRPGRLGALPFPTPCHVRVHLVWSPSVCLTHLNRVR